MATKKKKKAKAKKKKKLPKYEPVNHGRRGRCSARDANNQQCAGPKDHGSGHLNEAGGWATQPPLSPSAKSVKSAALGVLGKASVAMDVETSGLTSDKPAARVRRAVETRAKAKPMSEADIVRSFVCIAISNELGYKFESVEAALDALFRERRAFKREKEQPLELSATYLREKLGLPKNVVLEVHTPFRVEDGEGIELDDKDVLIRVKPRRR